MFVLAALLYNSWPLGYYLNSKIAHSGLASDLDGIGQPFYWLFILGDVLVGASLLAVTLLIIFKLRREFLKKTWFSVLVGVFIFGIFTATSAATSNSCVPGHLHFCATIDNHTFGGDGLESTFAALGLLVSLVGINVMSIRFKLSKNFKRFSQFVLFTWPVCVLWFLIEADKNGNAHLAQQALLTLTGLALLVIGLNIFAALEQLTLSDKST